MNNNPAKHQANPKVPRNGLARHRWPHRPAGDRHIGWHVARVRVVAGSSMQCLSRRELAIATTSQYEWQAANNNMLVLYIHLEKLLAEMHPSTMIHPSQSKQRHGVVVAAVAAAGGTRGGSEPQRPLRHPA
jgi:hypothetical protein